MQQAKSGKVGRLQGSFVVRDAKSGQFMDTLSHRPTTLPNGKVVRQVDRNLFDRAVAAAIREKK